MEPSWSRTSHQGVGCFTDDVVGRTGCCMDGMCPELWGGDIPSVKKAEMSIPLHLPIPWPRRRTPKNKSIDS